MEIETRDINISITNSEKLIKATFESTHEHLIITRVREHSASPLQAATLIQTFF